MQKVKSSTEYHKLAGKARSMVNTAIKSGIIAKGTTCIDCGKVGHGLHAHHEDYSKPYHVVWLCPKCHHRRPKRKRRMAISISRWPNNHIIADIVSEHLELPN